MTDRSQRSLPVRVATPCAVSQRPQVGDGGAVVGVAAEHLRDQDGLVRDDLVAGPGLGGLADVAVAERGAAEHVDAAGLRPPGLAAPVALHQLGLLVLGEHALELDEQLVLGAVAARPLHELHPHPAAGELLDQQRLVGELAGQPVRGVDQHDVEAALGGQVPQRLQRPGAPASPRSAPRRRTPTLPARQAGWSRRGRAARTAGSRSSGPSPAGRWRPSRRSPLPSRFPPSAAGAAVLARRCGTNIP